MRKVEGLIVKSIDALDDEPSAALATNILRELAGRTADYEVAFVGGQRRLQYASPQVAEFGSQSDIRRGGTWVLTGGARGITAQCALELVGASACGSI